VLNQSAADRGNHSIVRNTGYLVTARIVSRGLRVVYMVVLARKFGPELFGLLTYAQFWQLIFMSLAAFGTGRMLSLQLGADRGEAERFIATNISLRLLTSCLAMLGCGLVVLDPGLDPQGQGIVTIFAVALLARSMAAWAQQVFVAFEKSQLSLRQELLFRSLEVVLGLLVVAAGGGLTAVALVHAASWALQAWAGWWLVDDRLAPVRFNWHLADLLQLGRHGIAFMLVSLSLTMLLQGGLVLYKLLQGDPGKLGQLAVVLQALNLLSMVPKSMSAAALPVLSRWVEEGAGGERRSMTLMLRTSIIGAAGLALLASVLGPILIHWLVGHRYEVAAEAVPVALWLLLPISVCTLMNQLTMAHGEFRRAARISLLGALVTVLVIALAVHGLGVKAVVLGIAAGALVWSAAEAWFAIGAGWLDGFEAFGRPGLAVALAAGVFHFLADISPLLALFAAWLVLLPGLVSPRILWRRLRTGIRS